METCWVSYISLIYTKSRFPDSNENNFKHDEG